MPGYWEDLMQVCKGRSGLGGGLGCSGEAYMDCGGRVCKQALVLRLQTKSCTWL